MTINTDEVLEERGKRYGSYANHSVNLEQLINTLASMESYHNSIPIVRCGARMILDKLVRAFNGDWSYIDNWVDIEGYAKLVRTYLETHYGNVPEDTIPDNKATMYICSLFHPNRLHLFDKHCCNTCQHNQRGVCSKHNFVNAYERGDKCHCKICNRAVKCNKHVQNFMVELIKIYSNVSITDLETEIYGRFHLLNEMLATYNNNLDEDDRGTLEEICVKVVGNAHPDLHTFDLHYTIRDVISRYFITCDRYAVNPIYGDVDDNKCEHCQHWFRVCMFDKCKHYKEYQNEINKTFGTNKEIPECEHGKCKGCITCEVLNER